MATGGHALHQQQTYLETRIKTLLNSDLREICRANGLVMSGTKPLLQKRCIDLVARCVHDGNLNGLENLRHRVNNRGRDPSHNSGSSSSNQNTTTYQPYNSTPQRREPSLPMPSRNDHRTFFKPSPFHEVVDVLLPLTNLPEMPQNRHTVKAVFKIKPEFVQQIRGENLRIFMFCGLSQQLMAPYTQADVAFPNNIEVKVNDQDLRSNFKGLKNKPGTTKPAEITGFTRKFNEQSNHVNITYALTTKRYAFLIYLVRYIGTQALTERIKSGNVIPKQRVLNDMSKANADADIAATSIRMSLKDPVSTMRITLPVRSTVCTHNQCFDGSFFLQLQEQTPQWTCPVCSKNVSFDSLCIDKYFEDILDNTPRNIEKVDIEPDGQWTVIKEEEEDSQQPNGTSKEGRASYDDDFDDDLIEIDQPAPLKPVNGSGAAIQTSSFPPHAFAATTPSLPSREASVTQSTASTQRRPEKRSSSNIIDLTLSDEDDDDPPRRPKRRQMTDNEHGGGTNAHGTPTSLPALVHSSLTPNTDHRPASGSRHSDPMPSVSLHPSPLVAPVVAPVASPLNAPHYGASPWPVAHPRPAIQPPGGHVHNPGHYSMSSSSPYPVRPPSQPLPYHHGGGHGGQMGVFRAPALSPIVHLPTPSPNGVGPGGGGTASHHFPSEWTNLAGGSNNFSQSHGPSG